MDDYYHIIQNFSFGHRRLLLNAGTLELECIEPFIRLLELIEENKRFNQYK